MPDPVLSGYKWPSLNISVSFMLDGASCLGFPSRLFALYAIYPLEKWQGEFLRAVQCWMDACGLTISLSPDDGSSDVVGQPPTCGDIRFGASAGVSGLGHAVFPDPSPIGGTVTLNGSGPLNIGSNPDVFSLVLHELGAALGISEGQPDTSVLNGPGPYTGLFPIDVAGVQAMYGPPPSPDNRPKIWTAPPIPPSQLPAPGGLAAAPSWALLLTWSEVTGRVAFKIERQVGNGPWKVVEPSISRTYYSDGQMGQGHPPATYRITAIDAAGNLGVPAVIKV